MSSGDAVSVVISHVAAVSCIHVPTFETTEASQRFLNDGYRNGLQAVAESAGERGFINPQPSSIS
jgi:hypothetical protein